MMEPEFLDRLGRVAVNKVANADFYSQVYAEFVDTVDRVARPASIEKFFFVDGGALAVENALKAAFDWKVRRNFAAGMKKERGHQVMHLEWGVPRPKRLHAQRDHTADPRKTMYFPKFDWPRIPSPAIHFPLTDTENARLDAEEAETLSVARQHLEQGQGDVAAILLGADPGRGWRPAFPHEFPARPPRAGRRVRGPVDLRRGSDRRRYDREVLGIRALRRRT